MATAKKCTEVAAVTWVGSQATKLARVGGALLLAPLVDVGAVFPPRYTHARARTHHFCHSTSKHATALSTTPPPHHHYQTCSHTCGRCIANMPEVSCPNSMWLLRHLILHRCMLVFEVARVARRTCSSRFFPCPDLKGAPLAPRRGSDTTAMAGPPHAARRLRPGGGRLRSRDCRLLRLRHCRLGLKAAGQDARRCSSRARSRRVGAGNLLHDWECAQCTSATVAD